MRKIAHELIKRAYVQKLKDVLIKEQLRKYAGKDDRGSFLDILGGANRAVHSTFNFNNLVDPVYSWKHQRKIDELLNKIKGTDLDTLDVRNYLRTMPNPRAFFKFLQPIAVHNHLKEQISGTLKKHKFNKLVKFLRDKPQLVEKIPEVFSRMGEQFKERISHPEKVLYK